MGYRDTPESERAYKREKAKRYYDKNPEKFRRWAKVGRIKHQYGITLEAYEALMDMPCYVCGAEEKQVLDHDHKTGKVRGVLCHHCNLALGHAFDEPARLRALADYLERT